jgi:succinate dehydrogenase / fumarate reductase iron-sulfur subunit
VKVTLRVWRQPGPGAPGRLERYDADDISPEMSFLEMLDVVNEKLIAAG